MRSKRVLIADDDPAVRRLLTRILRDEFDVVEAADGEQAVTQALEHLPDVALLDLEMPVLDGHRALLRFRAEPALRTTPVLIVTGASTGGEGAAAFLRDGAHDFVRKPFEDMELLARVRAAHRHKALEEALRARNRELEAFATLAAHDLKSPLANISIVSELLTSDVVLTDEQRRGSLLDIRKMADQGRRLIADLLTLAREDWADEAMTGATADVEAVLRAVIAEVNLADAAIRMTGSWAKVSVPEPAVRSVFANLLINAGHYGRDKDGRLSCTLEGSVGADGLQVVFSDTGEGIPAVVAGRIFEPFVRGPGTSQRNPDSTGLGLAIILRTLNRHGSTVEWLQDGVPGARFRLTMPLG
jgi:two-component system, sensor histidine kinase and response regulator